MLNVPIGVPGGTESNSMLKANAITFAIFLGLSATAVANVHVNGVIGDGNVSLIYNPADGSLGLDAAGNLVSTLEVYSVSGVFVPPFDFPLPPPASFETPEHKFFLLTVTGMGDTEFEAKMQSGLTASFLGKDLTIAGSILPRGALPGGGDLVYLPEPSSLVLLFLGLLPSTLFRQRRSQS